MKANKTRKKTGMRKRIYKIAEKTGSKFGIILLLDIIFLALVLCLMIFFAAAYNWSTSVFAGLPLSKIQITDASKLAQFQEAIFESGKIASSFARRKALSMIAVFAIFIAGISAIKGLEWSILQKKKFSMKFFKKFLLLNLAWFGIWIFIFAAIFFAGKVRTVQAWFLIQAVLIAYLTPVMYAGFGADKKIKQMILSAFRTGITKAARILVLYFILAAIIGVSFALSLASAGFSAIFAVILFLLWHSLSKYYLVRIVKG